MEYYGNLAYKPRTPKVQVKKKETERKIKEKERAQMIARKVTVFRILYIVTLAFSATFMISKFVAVYDTGQEKNALINQLEKKQAYTSQKVFEMEQSVDLKEVEKIASEELGMQRPEKHQVIYVDVKTNDLSEVTASDVEGIKNRSSDFFGNLKKNIIGIFSIN